MKSRAIGPVPIIENEQTQKLVGIVTDRVLALKIVAHGRDNPTLHSPRCPECGEILQFRILQELQRRDRSQAEGRTAGPSRLEQETRAN